MNILQCSDKYFFLNISYKAGHTTKSSFSKHSPLCSCVAHPCSLVCIVYSVQCTVYSVQTYIKHAQHCPHEDGRGMCRLELADSFCNISDTKRATLLNEAPVFKCCPSMHPCLYSVQCIVYRHILIIYTLHI